jgi:hypothetical protein
VAAAVLVPDRALIRFPRSPQTHVPEITAIQRDLQQLELELKRLETEYALFFGNRAPRPPWEIRQRVERLVKRLENARIPSSAERFRFNTIQARVTSFTELWDRALRAREEGRPGPLSRPAPTEPRPPGEKPATGVVTLTDPVREEDKVKELYETVTEARRRIGQQPLPYDRFVELVRTEVRKLRTRGGGAAAFSVAVRDGKVNFTVKPLKDEK